MLEFNKQQEMQKAYNVLPSLVVDLQKPNARVSKISQRYKIHSDFIKLLKYGYIEELNWNLSRLGVKTLPVGAAYTGILLKPTMVKLLQALKQGQSTLPEIASNLGLSQGIVASINRGETHKLKLDYLDVTVFPVKDAVSQGRLSTAAVIGIAKDLKTSNLTAGDIAKKYNISRYTVQDINSGKCYSSVLMHAGVTEYPIRIRGHYIKKTGNVLPVKQLQKTINLLQNSDKTATEIGLAVGLTLHEVNNINVGRTHVEELKRLGVTQFPIRGGYCNLTFNQYKAVISDLKAGLSDRAIADRYQLDNSYINHIGAINKGVVNRYNQFNEALGIITFPIRPVVPPISEEKLKEIVDLILDEDVYLKDIDSAYNLPESTATHINNGTCYKAHVMRLGYTEFPLAKRKESSLRKEHSTKVIMGVARDLQNNHLNQVSISQRWGVSANFVTKLNMGNISKIYLAVLNRNGITTFPIRKGQFSRQILDSASLKGIIHLLQTTDMKLSEIGLKYGVAPYIIQTINSGVSYRAESKKLGITKFPIRN